MPPIIGQLLALVSSPILLIAPTFLLFGYFFAVWDQRKADSDSKDDGQIGVKLAIVAIVIFGLGIAASGATTLLHYLLSGAKTGSDSIKSAIAALLVGGIAVAVFAFVFLPRTNSRDYPKATRLGAGAVAFVGSIVAILFLTLFVNALILGKGGGDWNMKSGFLAYVVVNAGLGIGALVKLGGISGWTAPVRPVAPQPSGGYGQPMHQQMPQQQGYPPQQQGYPPQQQQQQGYPPQGGGYPPQGGGGGGGGYPPQGGGY